MQLDDNVHLDIQRVQPVILAVERRVECKCGALAIWVALKRIDENADPADAKYYAMMFCQDCWEETVQDE